MADTNAWNIGGDGGNSFPFDRPGDQVTGQIVNLREVQQTDLQTGEPKTFSNGQPMMMYRVTLATQLRDPRNQSDDGHRDVYLKGSRKTGCQSSLAAVLDAVKATTGGSALEPNATLTLRYVGDGPQPQRGFNPPKLYQAAYQRPSMNIGAAPSVQQPQPAYQHPDQNFPQPMAQQPAHQYAQSAQVPYLQPPMLAPAAPTPAPAPALPQPSPEQVAAMRNAGYSDEQIRAMFPGYAG